MTLCFRDRGVATPRHLELKYSSDWQIGSVWSVDGRATYKPSGGTGKAYAKSLGSLSGDFHGNCGPQGSGLTVACVFDPLEPSPASEAREIVVIGGIQGTTDSRPLHTVEISYSGNPSSTDSVVVRLGDSGIAEQIINRTFAILANSTPMTLWGFHLWNPSGTVQYQLTQDSSVTSVSGAATSATEPGTGNQHAYIGGNGFAGNQTLLAGIGRVMIFDYYVAPTHLGMLLD